MANIVNGYVSNKNNEFKESIFRKICLHALFWFYLYCFKEFITLC